MRAEQLHPRNRYDVVIIGGGAAGLSAAVTLGRALRSVVVLDAGQPRNAPAKGVHGFLTREGMSPLQLLEVGRTEAGSYGADIRPTEAVAVRRTADGFSVDAADGGTVVGRRVLFATGLADGLPDIPGLRDQWGEGVVHCPYCHGYEIRGQRIGVLATGPMSMHQALLFRQWSEDITFFLNDAAAPTDEEWDKLAARGIRVVDGQVASVHSVDGVLSGVTLTSGTPFALDALAVGTRMEARGELLASLGVAVEPHASGMGTFIAGGPMGSTSVPGVYVAGNVSNLSAQVIVAAAEGTMAGAAINADLVQEETAWAVEGLRGPFSAASEAAVAERLLGARRHGLDLAITAGDQGEEDDDARSVVVGSIIEGTSTREELRRAG